MKSIVRSWISITLVVMGFSACERGKTTTEPAGTVDQAVQQTVDGIKGPMDKARGVEETLSQAAERTAEQASQAAP